MRLSILTFLAVSCLLLTPTAARAQFATRSVGIGGQATTSINNAAQWAITLEGSVYIESGFDVYLRIPVMLTETPVGASTQSGAGQVLGSGGNLGVRYLFLEEQIRPYVGLHLSALVLFTQPLVNGFAGLGATVGTDFFVTDFLAIGVRGTYDIFIDLNKPPRHNFGAGLNVTTFF